MCDQPATTSSKPSLRPSPTLIVVVGAHLHLMYIVCASPPFTHSPTHSATVINTTVNPYYL
ncbi:hypothetical protein EX30DRAFT_343299, partial [Ascodesmis nigricans]